MHYLRSMTGAAMAAVWVLAWGVSPASGQTPRPERVAEIAEMLSARPAGFGRPISDRDAWDRLSEHSSFRSVVSRAESLMAQPLPESPDGLYLEFSETGNRTGYQNVASARRGRVLTFTLAEAVEHQGRFLEPLEKVIAALSAERTWVLPAHDGQLHNFHGRRTEIDLASATLGWDLAMADYLLGDQLSEKCRKQIRAQVTRRSLTPFREMVEGRQDRSWWLTTTNNWNSVCLAGVVGAALALVDSPEERAWFVAAGEEYVRNFLRGFTPDGYCSEGLGYWNYGFGYFTLLAEAMAQATGGKVDLFTWPEVRAPALYGARVEIAGDVYPTFSDCSVGSRPDSFLMDYISRRYGLGLARWERADTLQASGSLYRSMMHGFPNTSRQARASDAPAMTLDKRDWFADAGVLIARPAANGKGQMAVALKGGHNAEHHNHNDVGSFMVVVDGKTVLTDPGAEVYTARTFSGRRYDSQVINSFGHSVPRVAGELQRVGGDALAQVIEKSLEDDRDRIVFDIRSAYAVPTLEGLTRSFEYHRAGKGRLVVRDAFFFSEPETFETALITFGRWREEGNVLFVEDDGVWLQVEVDTGGRSYEVSGVTLEEDVRAPRAPVRVAITLREKVRDGAVTCTITPVE